MKISVITATYNSGKTLRDTVESVLNQDYPDIEYIIIDGASKDNTTDIIREYECRFNGRIKWISEPDKGIYDAMNKGIAMATGDIVGILNSDDFYTSNDVLATVASAFKNNGIDAVYGDIHYVNDDDLKKCVRYYSSKAFKRWQMRLGLMPAHPSFYCRKKLYEKYGGFDLSYKVAADFECLLRLIFVHKIRTQYIPMDFVTMRTGGASTNGLASHKQILKDHLKAYKKNGVYSNIFFESLRYAYKVLDVTGQKIFKSK
ncbi:glycosyltransferase family 2 protein [Coprobacter secundus]|uniref:glycosyltransferase family 2 protein n=1 Tax=Coprobacter secundus TaxID=1501392 RepID=UPI0035216EF8